jgi:hypothetical protein
VPTTIPLSNSPLNPDPEAGAESVHHGRAQGPSRILPLLPALSGLNVMFHVKRDPLIKRSEGQSSEQRPLGGDTHPARVAILRHPDLA